MHPAKHIVLTTAAALGARRRLGRFPWIFWAAGILADVDHFLWYAVRHGDPNPLAAWRHFTTEETLAPDHRLPLHRYELILPALLFARSLHLLGEGAAGLAFHRLLDDVTALWRVGGRSWRRRQRQRLQNIVFARAGYVCQGCGATGVPLELHHRLPERWGGPNRPHNLVALCRPCHDRAHGRSCQG